MKTKLEKLKQEIENILNEDRDVNETEIIIRLRKSLDDTGLDVVSRNWSDRMERESHENELLQALISHGVDNWEGYDLAWEYAYGEEENDN